GLYLFVYFLLLALLVYITFILLEKQVHPFLNDPAFMLAKAKKAIYDVQQQAGITFISEDTMSDLQRRLSDFLPRLVNDTVNLVLNLALLLFVLYYMLVHGK